MVQARAGSGNVVALMVRVPEDLRDRIKAAAEANGRSQNSEIVATLEREYPLVEINTEDLLKEYIEVTKIAMRDKVPPRDRGRAIDRMKAIERMFRSTPPDRI